MLLVLVFTLLVTAATIKIYFKLTFGRCKCKVSLVGKTAVVTGANSGLGYQVALALAGRGCKVIMADKDNCEKSKEEIIQTTGNDKVVVKHFDLASINSIRKLGREINETEERLDILINNAGIFGHGNSYTEDNLNMQMQVNHFGPFLLTHLLVELLKKSAPSRIIFVSSLSAYQTNLTLTDLNSCRSQSGSFISAGTVYGNSKLCNIITAKEFAKKLQGAGVTANSLHPGVVFTPVLQTFFSNAENRSIINTFYRLLFYYTTKLFCKTAEEGAQTTVHLALARKLEKVTGKFFADCQESKIPDRATDDLFSRQIWKASENFVQLAPEERL